MKASYTAGDDDRVIDSRDEEIRAALIEQCGLSAQDVAMVADVMRGSGIGFREAALRIGLITPEDIGRVLRPAGAGARHGSGRHSGPDVRGNAGPVQPVWRGRRDTLLHDQPTGTPVRPAPGLSGLNDRFSPRSERMLALRTELLLTQSETANQACMIAVISAFPGEGRSRLAAELAISFAQLRDSTLLVDGDMRRPSQHRLFSGADSKSGLAQAIAAGVQPAVQPVEGLPELSVLSAGTVPANPLDLLSDVRFEDLMMAWRNQYRFVIIDTPPVSECADALAIAHTAGRALVVCRADRTTYDGARAMLRRLAMTQAEVMGAVVTHF
mgnify:CR=1 FL=1